MWESDRYHCLFRVVRAALLRAVERRAPRGPKTMRTRTRLPIGLTLHYRTDTHAHTHTGRHKKKHPELIETSLASTNLVPDVTEPFESAAASHARTHISLLFSCNYTGSDIVMLYDTDATNPLCRPDTITAGIVNTKLREHPPLQLPDQ